MEERKDLLGKLESAKAKLSQVSKMKCAVVLENFKVINVVKGCMCDYKKSASIRNFLPPAYMGKERACKKIGIIF